MDQLDRNILDILQFSFPLTLRPYRSVGTRVGVSERKVIDRIAALKKKGIVRQISPIFDSARIGYRSTLIAFKVGSDRVDQVAEHLDAHPGVTHSYLREDEVNLWFTLTVPRAMDLRAETGRLARAAGVSTWLYLPAIRTFKISFRLDMGDASRSTATSPASTARGAGVNVSRPFVRALQEDLPLATRPFRGPAAALGLTEREVLSMLQRYIDNGIVRRVASILRPTKAGFGTNIMVAWAPAPGDLEHLGTHAATHHAISHCYHRPSYPAWPYTVYTMIHGTTHDSCQAVIDTIAGATRVTHYRCLPTVKEYTKRRMKYF